jgi:hypothetical protein
MSFTLVEAPRCAIMEPNAVPQQLATREEEPNILAAPAGHDSTAAALLLVPAASWPAFLAGVAGARRDEEVEVEEEEEEDGHAEVQGQGATVSEAAGMQTGSSACGSPRFMNQQ